MEPIAGRVKVEGAEEWSKGGTNHRGSEDGEARGFWDEEQGGVSGGRDEVQELSEGRNGADGGAREGGDLDYLVWLGTLHSLSPF